MRDEGIGDGLTFLFICLAVFWIPAIIVINLPREIGSLLGWSQLGRFPLNAPVFYFLMIVGWIVLFIIFRLVFRILGTKGIFKQKEI